MFVNLLKVVCNRPEFTVESLNIMCYFVLALLIATAAILTGDNTPPDASRAVEFIVLLTFSIYTLLPIRRGAAVLGGIILASIHILFSLGFNLHLKYLWRQV